MSTPHSVGAYATGMKQCLAVFGGGRRLLLPTGPGAFRLWLALMVVVHHISRVEIGKTPVLVFFALSGYWVSRVWRSRYVRCRSAWLTFVISRWWRVAPLTALASLMSLLAYWGLSSPEWPLIADHFAAQLIAPFTLVGYAQLPVKPLGPAWSLDVEMQFYIVAPLLMMVVARWSALSIILLGMLIFLGALTMNWVAVLPVYLIFFLLGLLAAQHEWRTSAALSLGGVFAAAGLVLLCAPGAQRQRWLGEGADYSAFLNLALAACLLPFALSTVAGRSDAVDRTMGDWSFLLYLFHWPLVIAFRQAGEGRWDVLAAGAPLLAFALYAIWRRYDRPFERLRANWVKSRMLRENEANPAAERKKGDTPPHFA